MLPICEKISSSLSRRPRFGIKTTFSSINIGNIFDIEFTMGAQLQRNFQKSHEKNVATKEVKTIKT